MAQINVSNEMSSFYQMSKIQSTCTFNESNRIKNIRILHLPYFSNVLHYYDIWPHWNGTLCLGFRLEL